MLQQRLDSLDQKSDAVSAWLKANDNVVVMVGGESPTFSATGCATQGSDWLEEDIKG